MSIHYRTQGRSIIVFGNTYPYRERIKALGGRFNGSDKNWRLTYSKETLACVDELCSSVGGGPATPGPAATDTTPGKAASSGPAAVAAAPTPKATEDTASDENGLTIRQLMDKVNLALTSSFPAPVWVIGEIQNLSERRSGLFLDLAEARDGGHGNSTVTARAIIWRRARQFIKASRGEDVLKEILQDGMKVRCLCQVQLYKDRGFVTLSIEDIDPAYTKGALALAREKLLKELRAKGLDRQNKAVELTPFPFRVGLISAEGSRAESDFLNQLEAGGFPGEVLFIPSPMQGEQVPHQVSAALKTLARRGCDLIVVTRGGGSAADLRWFDAPEIAYAIAGLPVPVVAAIGHHDDVCVAEEICFERQKTPTAAAEYVRGVFDQSKERIDRAASALARRLTTRIDEFTARQGALSERLHAAAQTGLKAREDRHATLAQSLLSLTTERVHQTAERTSALLQTLFSAAGEKLHRLSQHVSRLDGDLTLGAHKSLARLETHLAGKERELIRLDPSPWLDRGWTQLTGAKGPVLSVDDMEVGEEVTARLRDGRLGLRVETQEKTPRLPGSGGRPAEPSPDEDTDP